MMTRNCINVYVPNLRTECREGRLRSIRSLPSTMETENRERHEDVASLGYRDRNMNDKALLWNATLSRSLGRTNQFTLKLDAHDILRRTSSVRYTLNAMGQSETGHGRRPAWACTARRPRLALLLGKHWYLLPWQQPLLRIPQRKEGRSAEHYRPSLPVGRRHRETVPAGGSLIA